MKGLSIRRTGSVLNCFYYSGSGCVCKEIAGRKRSTKFGNSLEKKVGLCYNNRDYDKKGGILYENLPAREHSAAENV